MPNHVTNLVRITGPDKQPLCDFVKTKDNPFDFQNVAPCPNVLWERISPFRPQDGETPKEAEQLRQTCLEKYGAETWYEWCIEHWGTKWNSYHHNTSLEHFDFCFDTAWGSPVEIFEALSRMFTVEITVIACEEFDCFCTEYQFSQGNIVSEREIDND